MNLFFIIILSVVSGFGDSQGFYFASRIWNKGSLDYMELGKSAFGFSVGIITYWIMIRNFHAMGVNSTLLQTMIWFAATVVGIAFVRGEFFTWHRMDKIIALLVLTGIAWLLFRAEASIS